MMIEWNLYWPMLEAALKDWPHIMPTVYLEIINLGLSDVELEMVLNPFVGC